jgi:hypothetical protein
MKEMRLKRLFFVTKKCTTGTRWRVESKVQAFFSKKIDFVAKINYYSTFKRNFESTIDARRKKT